MEDFCTATQQGAYLEREMTHLRFSCIRFGNLVTYVGMPMLLPKQPIEIGWLCLETQVLFDHLQLIVRTVCLKISYLRKNPICLQFEHSQIDIAEIVLTIFQGALALPLPQAQAY